MSLNDPFGRVSRRQAQAYSACREQLRTSGITSIDQVTAQVHRLGRNLLGLTGVVALVAIMAGWLFPSQRTWVGVVTTLVLLLLGSGFVQTRACLARYRNELARSGDVDDGRGQPETPKTPTEERNP